MYIVVLFSFCRNEERVICSPALPSVLNVSVNMCGLLCRWKKGRVNPMSTTVIHICMMCTVVYVTVKIGGFPSSCHVVQQHGKRELLPPYIMLLG